MKSYDVVIIGGGPSGIIVGVTGKKQNPEKSFLMITEKPKGLVPCGIPYLFHDLEDVSKNAMGPKPFVDLGGELWIDKVNELDSDGKVLKTEKGETVKFDKLVDEYKPSVVISMLPYWSLWVRSYLKYKDYKFRALESFKNNFLWLGVADLLSALKGGGSHWELPRTLVAEGSSSRLRHRAGSGDPSIK